MQAKKSFHPINLICGFLLFVSVQAFANDPPKLEYSPQLIQASESSTSNKLGVYYDYNDAYVKLSLGWPMVSGKFYPNLSVGFFLHYLGMDFSFGKIYNQEALEDFDDKKNLGYYIEFDLYTKLNLLESRMVSISPGFNFTHHSITIIDPEDAVGYNIFSFTLKAEVLFFDHLGLSYKVNLPLSKPDDLRFRNSRFLQAIGVNYRFYVR